MAHRNVVRQPAAWETIEFGEKLRGLCVRERLPDSKVALAMGVSESAIRRARAHFGVPPGVKAFGGRRSHKAAIQRDPTAALPIPRGVPTLPVLPSLVGLDEQGNEKAGR